MTILYNFCSALHSVNSSTDLIDFRGKRVISHVRTPPFLVYDLRESSVLFTAAVKYLM